MKWFVLHSEIFRGLNSISMHPVRAYVYVVSSQSPPSPEPL